MCSHDIGLSIKEPSIPFTLVTMTVIVNGEPKSCPDGLSLAQFIDYLDLKGDRVAVELNRQIASRGTWGERLLSEGDRLEIVHFVGGG